jgi:hypothetical protein
MSYPTYLYNVACVTLLLAAPLTTALATTPTPSPTPSSTQRTVSFGWTASPDPSVLGYKIYWGTGSGNYQNVRDVKKVMTTSLVLTNANKYYVAVTAYDLTHESYLSNEVVVPTAGTGR